MHVVPEPESPSLASRLAARPFALGVAVALGVGVFVRANAVLASDFPLNDGGLFYAMMRDLQAHGYRLPAYTSYNGGDIPFAYPPFALYTGALLAGLTPLSLIDVLRFVPLTVSSLTIVAFALLARDALGRGSAAGAATVAFALLPRSFLWMIMGGGLTRSFGFLFAVLGVWLAYRAIVLHDRRAIPVFGLAGCLAILSHLEMALLMMLGTSMIAAFRLRDSRTAVALALALGGMAVATAPWWGTIVARHGMDPFLNAPRSNADFQHGATALVRIVRFQVTGEILFPVILLACSAGFVVAVARRDYLLPLWLATAVVIDLRSFPMFAMLPSALLAGIGWAELSALAGRAASSRPKEAPHPSRARSLFARAAPGVVVGLIVYYATVSALVTAAMPTLEALDRANRDAMAWAKANTPPSSAFAVISGDARGWAQDEISEWFPALTDRRSVATVQGSEWLRGAAAGERLEMYDALQRCAFHDAGCLSEWSATWDSEFDYVYVVTNREVQTGYAERFGFEECCDTLRRSLSNDPAYRLAYDGPGVSIFERVGMESPASPRTARFLTPSEGHR